MSGLNKKQTEREAILATMKTSPPGGYYVWDGKNEDDRPASADELRAGIEAYRRSRGRPVGSGTKEQVAIRFDRDVLEAFRTSGPGWQTRMNAALKEWLKSHPKLA
ncbi:conserved hypothetical protein [Thiomonas sp. X19]|nr:conserved hypothetical protein [Thiomonas sp. X19]